MSDSAAFGTARHPFRARLPLRVLRRMPQPEPEVRARMAQASAAAEPEGSDCAPRKRRLVTVQDVKDFLLAYCACLVAVSAYLS